MEIDEITTETLKNQMSQELSEWMERTQSGMFSVLSLLTKGEANQLVRSCEAKNGCAAWKKLHDRFNPKTPASLAAAWRDVIRPKKIKDMRGEEGGGKEGGGERRGGGRREGGEGSLTRGRVRLWT